MRKYMSRLACAVLALVMLCCAMPAAVWAESSETEATTTTTAAPKTVVLDQLRIKGSNSKIYLCSPTLSNDVDEYSFNVPDWMEVVTVTFIGKEGMAATCSNQQSVVSTGTSYSVSVELSEKKQTVTLSLSDGSLSRDIDITINRKQIDCYIEDIMLYVGDNEVDPEGDIDDGAMTFTLKTGTLSDVTMRVKPRHENLVTLTNTTLMAEGETITDNDKHKLTINRYSTYYPVDLCDGDVVDKLVEGTNTFYVEVTAGDITRTCEVTVIVGDPAANATTTTTTTTTLPTTTTTTSATVPTYTTTSSYLPQVQGGQSTSMLGDIPTVLWILIGIIALVVIGSCIFMIVSMTSNNRNNMNGYNGGYNGNYDYDYDMRPMPRRRRNLTEYLDDDYDDYGDYNRGRGGRYDDYDDYDQPSGRGGRYDSYNGFESYDGYDNYNNYDNYEQPARRYDDYDNYDDGSFGGY